MDIKYNVYYSAYENGPWTLANDTPIDHSDSEMSCFIPNLDPNTKYYIVIMGGYIEDNEFIPLQPQPIGPNNIGANALTANASSGSAVPASIEIVTNSPKQIANSDFTHIFSIT